MGLGAGRLDEDDGRGGGGVGRAGTWHLSAWNAAYSSCDAAESDLFARTFAGLGLWAIARLCVEGWGGGVGDREH